VRVDAGVEEGGDVTPFYDPMIAKIIAYGATRDEALDRLSRALGDTIVAGPRTNVAFLKALCDAPGFRAENFDTGFIDRNLAALGATPRPLEEHAAAFGGAALIAIKSRKIAATRSGAPSPWDVLDAFQTGGSRGVPQRFEIDGRRIDATLEWVDGGPEVTLGGARENARWKPPYYRSRDNTMIAVKTDDGVIVVRDGAQTIVRWPDYAVATATTAEAGNAVVSPMHGKLVALHVKVGDIVHAHQRVAVVEAMKMEHALTAPIAGRVASISGSEGAQVAQGARLIIIEPDGGGTP
jgi:3-methylcrotonyl-CoA carboxylase alpha subunit